MNIGRVVSENQLNPFKLSGLSLQKCLDLLFLVSLYNYCFTEIPVFNANSVDPDQMLHSVMSDLGLNYLPVTFLEVPRLKWVKDFMISAQGQGRIIHKGQNFDCNRRFCYFDHKLYISTISL